MKRLLLFTIWIMIALSANAQYKKSESDLPGSNCPPEIYPEFSDGIKKWKAFINKNLRWPKDDCVTVEGRVFVSFNIEKDGSLTDIRVVRNLAPAFDKEALRVINKSPKWIPGKQMGKPVRCGYTIGIPFHLSEN